MDINLKNQIRTAIAPWIGSAKKPFFTIEELVVVAATLNPHYTQKALLLWIMKHFRYYNELALALACTWQLFGEPYGEEARSLYKFFEFKNAFEKVFDQFEVPLVLNSDEDDGEGSDEEMDQKPSPTTWSVTSSAARIFLGPKLWSSETKSDAFPFMRLPRELRDEIYELALVMPKSGISVDTIDSGDGSKNGPFSFEVFSRDYNESHWRRSYIHKFDPDKDRIDQVHFFSNKRILECRPFQSNLALLLVSKQLYQEAMPIFYGGNHFARSTIGDLRRFLEFTPESRKDYIGHVSFHMNNQVARIARTTFELLKEVKYLREIDTWISETELGAVQTRRKSKKYFDMLKIPGLQVLGIKAYLGPLMTMEVKSETLNRQRKRKADTQR
ncbi:hypothetical protein LTR37_018533 [Vermiconidia calcicola]|uniref:Uncharacterized protein n=1 Tax=Vermiconidia calcicola TaxID=1690605 RepID=A0ACC3MGT4_9PEZI|nr:hypothetical protein LTR37_018533 [Vermiconidia calcicola]